MTAELTITSRDFLASAAALADRIEDVETMRADLAAAVVHRQKLKSDLARAERQVLELPTEICRIESRIYLVEKIIAQAERERRQAFERAQEVEPA